MFPIDARELDELNADDLDRLARLDADGLMIAPGEDVDAFRERLRREADAFDTLESQLEQNGSAEPFPGIAVAQKDRIPENILSEAGETTRKLYGFEVKFVPGFFLSGEVGLLWGGCSISDTEEPLTIFLIRSSFRKSQRFFIYSRRELLAHELCHTVRRVLRDMLLEEHFAYQTSSSRLRRYLGNCFIRPSDALLFTAPALVLLASQVVQTLLYPGFPVWIFWCILPIYPGYLLVRNALARRLIARATGKLTSLTDTPLAVLFRMKREEIVELADTPDAADFFERHSAELRFAVLKHRFIHRKGERHETR